MNTPNSNSEKREFIGGLIASMIVKKGVDIVVEKALNKVAAKPSVPMNQAAVEPAKEEVVKKIQEDVQARAEHQLDIEPIHSSRNVIGSLIGIVTELGIMYAMWNDGIPQDFQTGYAPHLVILGTLLTPLYSRFIAKKPLFR